MKTKIILLSLVLSVFLINLVAADILWDETYSRVDLAQGYFCPSPYTMWVDTNEDPFEYYPTIGSGEQLFDCRDPYEGPSCCPVYSTCQDIGVDTASLEGYPGIEGYTCVASTEIHCSQFTSPDACENEATVPIAKQSIELNPDYGEGYCNKVIDVWEPVGQVCWNQTACQCVWNGTSCLAEARIETECNDTAEPTTLESCDYQIIYDDSQCNEPGGQINATWILISEDPEGVCEPTSSYWIPCTEIMKLVFFTLISVIGVIVILGVIYYIYILKKGKKIKKK